MAPATNVKIAAARADAVEERKTGESTPTMSALSSGSGVAARLAPAKPKTRGFLHIVRHGGGPNAIYIVTYHPLDREGTPPALCARPPSKPAPAEGAPGLIALLGRIGVGLR